MTEPRNPTKRVLHWLFWIACFLGLVATENAVIKWLAGTALGVDTIISMSRLIAQIQTQQALRRKHRAQAEIGKAKP